MNSNGNFQNLWLFDLVAMLALLFMAVILLRAEVTKRTTMPVVTSLVKEDSTNFSLLKYQIDELIKRLKEIRSLEESHTIYTKDKSALDTLLANPNYRRAIVDTTLDIFDRVDTLLYTRKKSGKLINELAAIRNTLLHDYLRETRIERKLITEDELKFAIDEAIPYSIHPETGKSLNTILAAIYDTVDTFIAKGYNVIKIIGHTDPTHTEKHNRELSRRRAEYLARKIQDYIDNEYGSDKTYIVQATGYGEFALLDWDPKLDDSRRAYWQRNRRVELLFSFQRF